MVQSEAVIVCQKIDREKNFVWLQEIGCKRNWLQRGVINCVRYREDERRCVEQRGI